MRPESPARLEYVAAFREMASRIARSLKDAPPDALPIRMYVAGGAALHFHTGERVSAAGTSIVASLEEIVLLKVLPRWRANVRGLWWVLRERRAG